MDQETKQFAWGIGLAWVPLVLLLGPTLFHAFSGVSQEKATGLAAVAGGFSEALVTFGLLAFVLCQLAAIFLLVRGIRREQWRRSVAALISVVCSVFFLVLMGLAIWWLSHLRAATNP